MRVCKYQVTVLVISFYSLKNRRFNFMIQFTSEYFTQISEKWEYKQGVPFLQYCTAFPSRDVMHSHYACMHTDW